MVTMSAESRTVSVSYEAGEQPVITHQVLIPLVVFSTTQ
jgi:hypothetical protein